MLPIFDFGQVLHVFIAGLQEGLDRSRRIPYLRNRVAAAPKLNYCQGWKAGVPKRFPLEASYPSCGIPNID